jgi:hypothetical protein
MKPLPVTLYVIISIFLLPSCATQPPVVELEKPDILPLSLNPAFQIRKIKQFFLEPEEWKPTASIPANAERAYYTWGALDSTELNLRRGNYIDVFWRTSERADVTVRLEYRQTKLGNKVSAKEVFYPSARGSYRSQFKIVGDEYLEFGRVTQWRVLLIVNGRIVAFRQSFLWK